MNEMCEVVLLGSAGKPDVDIDDVWLKCRGNEKIDSKIHEIKTPSKLSPPKPDYLKNSILDTAISAWNSFSEATTAIRSSLAGSSLAGKAAGTNLLKGSSTVVHFGPAAKAA